MASAARTVPSSDAVKSSSSKTTVADPGAIDLSKKYPSITKAFALFSREFVLCQMHKAVCLTERVRWAMIASSICGPDVREGCFVRKQDGGWLVRDEAGQVYPLRAKHLLAMLNLSPENRGHIHESLSKLKQQQFFTEHGPDKIWYITVDPAQLSKLIQESVRQNATGPRSNLPNTSPFFRLAGHPFDLSQITDPVKRLEAEAVLNSLQDEYNSARKLLRDSIRKRAEFVLFGDSILITEKLEELVISTAGGGETCTTGTESPEPKLTPPPPPPSEDSHEISVASTSGGSLPGDHSGLLRSPPPRDGTTPGQADGRSHRPSPEAAGDRDESHRGNRAIRVSRTGLEVVAGNSNSTDLFEVFCFIMAGSGRPVSVRSVDECRRVFFRHPPETQQRIVDDAIIRSQGKWRGSEYTPAPLKYLNSEIWDIEPITARKFQPPKQSRQQERDDALRELMRESLERDRKRGGPLR